MANFLNLGNEKFLNMVNQRIFVDKSMLIKYCNQNIKDYYSSRFMCVTRPRRFGKTMALSMLEAYYSKGYDSKELFKNLKIYNDPSFLEHLNKHNVFTIDMAGVGTSLQDKKEILNEITKSLISDLNEAYPNILTNENTISKALIKIYSVTKETFIFLIDEWDYIYREFDNDIKLCNAYTDFLRSLFKNSATLSCIDLVYMTGILPIKRYNSQSSLNNFIEYNMLDPYTLTEFVGFTEEEVKDVNVSRFRNDLTAVDNKDAALTVLIHLGYLAYDRENEQCYIPNYEIRQELNNGVLDLKWEEIEYPLINSKELIKQTVLLNTKYIEERLNENLQRFTTIYNRLDENVLSVLLNVSYDYARKEYNFFKEPNVGIGRADLILVPYRTTKPGIIFELKVDSSPIDAIKQIKQKNYLESFNTYKGKILLIGINLDSKTKKHSVLIEEVNK